MRCDKTQAAMAHSSPSLAPSSWSNPSTGPSSLLKKVFDPGRHASLIQKSNFHRTINSQGAPTQFFSFGHFEAVRLFQQTADDPQRATDLLGSDASVRPIGSSGRSPFRVKKRSCSPCSIEFQARSTVVMNRPGPSSRTRPVYAVISLNSAARSASLVGAGRFALVNGI